METTGQSEKDMRPRGGGLDPSDARQPIKLVVVLLAHVGRFEETGVVDTTWNGAPSGTKLEQLLLFHRHCQVRRDQQAWYPIMVDDCCALR